MATPDYCELNFGTWSLPTRIITLCRIISLHGFFMTDSYSAWTLMGINSSPSLTTLAFWISTGILTSLSLGSTVWMDLSPFHSPLSDGFNKQGYFPIFYARWWLWVTRTFPGFIVMYYDIDLMSAGKEIVIFVIFELLPAPFPHACFDSSLWFHGFIEIKFHIWTEFKLAADP